MSSNPRVLIVDDDSDTRALVSAMLQPYGVEVRTAAAARAALETLKEFKADLLISDIGMPGDDGYTFIQKVRALAKEREGPYRLPAIALTTDSSVLTAYANDFDFSGVFARQVQALTKKRVAVVPTRDLAQGDELPGRPFAVGGPS